METGSDSRKAGAVNALYWTGMPLDFGGRTPPAYTSEYALPESRAAYEALSDVWIRKRKLLLEEFVFNTNVDVRRSIVSKLNLNQADYPET